MVTDLSSSFMMNEILHTRVTCGLIEKQKKKHKKVATKITIRSTYFNVKEEIKMRGQ